MVEIHEYTEEQKKVIDKFTDVYLEMTESLSAELIIANLELAKLQTLKQVS